MRKILKNLGYQTVYQILAICLPLITSPYLSRILGAEGLGKYSYSYSIVNYFTLFALLGTINYGSRSIALVKSDLKETEKTFWSIFSLQVMTSILALIAYIVFLRVFVKENLLLSCVQGIWIIGCALDINWFFFGIEEFKVTVIRNTIIKLLTVVAIFVFIKEAGDTWKYAIIMSGGTLVSQIVLWPFLFKRIGYYLPTWKEIGTHLKPNLLLFIPLLGLSIYHIMDKTMLGIMCASSESGYYYNADKVMSIPFTVIVATGTVMLPKMTEIVASGDEKKEKILFSSSVEGFMLLTIGLAFGIAAVAERFVPIFFGTGYEPCIPLIYIFSVIMICKSLANIIRNQFLIPHHLEKLYSYSVFVGAALNLVANYLFIVKLKMGALGACYGTLVAEFATCILYVFFIKRKVQIIQDIIRLIPYVIMGGIMYVVVIKISVYIPKTVWGLMLEIVVGGGIYITMCLAYGVKNKKSIVHVLCSKTFTMNKINNDKNSERVEENRNDCNEG